MCAVVAERCDAIKFASQRNTAACYSDSDRAQHKRAPANGRSKFVLLLPKFSRFQKLKTRDESSLEQENAKRETDKGDQTRGLDRQANIACAQDRPQGDCERNDRYNNEDADGREC